MILKDINWLDIFFIILLLGMVYKGSMTGVGGQILSLAGWFIAIFAAIGYYALLSEAIFGFLLQTWAKPISFFVIVTIIFIIVKLIERIFIVTAGEELATLEKVGGVLAALLRVSMIYGMIGILLLLIPIDNLRQSVSKGSKTCMYFVNMDVGIYSWMTGVSGPSGKRQKEDVIKEVLNSGKRP